MKIDKTILKKCQRGHEPSLRLLYRHCFDLLMPICMRYKENENDAVSALHVVFLRLIKRIDLGYELEQFNGWAKRIMVNQLIDEYRKTNRSLMTTQSGLEEQHFEIDSKNYELNIGFQDLEASEIMGFIQSLTEPRRTVFNLHALEGYSHDEIAERLNMTPENSRYYLHKARQILKQKVLKLNKTIKSI